jgi:alkanesulfonate monooxygenase SsuD/methylene tetrahydromethanopterin reductase-like flavin-dependent oxidoreductase (luciferase family)
MARWSSCARPGVARTDRRVHLPIAAAGTTEKVADQIRTLFDGADELMAYLLVPTGETIESVIELTAEAAGTSASVSIPR